VEMHGDWCPASVDKDVDAAWIVEQMRAEDCERLGCPDATILRFAQAG
jgi:hypothetical protein